MLSFTIVPITELLSTLRENPKIGKNPGGCLVELITNLRDDLWCFIEEPYTDRIYRDAYYHFYSSKLDNYDRNCLRISLFEAPIRRDWFFSPDGHVQLKKTFVGFSVIRYLPHSPKPGRTALSPRALKRHSFICELAPVKANIGGVKVHVDAFPFSSQDGECMTCAETSIWAVMEYYGNKYPEVKLTLPSEIHKAFQRNMRVLPSEGLTVLEIASALTHFGFGTYIYSLRKDEHGRHDKEEADRFRRNLFYYIESGIPVILGLSGKQVGHAVVAIGHEEINSTEMSKQLTNVLLPPSQNECVDTADIPREIILIDDNYPPYQKTTFDNPCSYYTDSCFQDCVIDYFIVPLNQKIYLEARKASKLISIILEDQVFGWKKLSTWREKPLIKRIFLTTSNSYKSFILQSDMHIKLKEVIQELVLPKFIWIAELSTPDIYLEGKACGIILIDATGTERVQSIKFLLYPGTTGFDYGTFNIYRNNLKSE